MKHTLSPWIAEPDTQTHCGNRHWIVGVSRNDGRRAHVAGDVVTHNVSLICAAPDMLAALLDVLSSEPGPALNDRVRAAIAKAIGDQS